MFGMVQISYRSNLIQIYIAKSYCKCFPARNQTVYRDTDVLRDLTEIVKIYF